jgi:aspartate kinase
MIVMKFGGSSVESAEAIARVASIVRERRDREPLVVVSAMGKTTNRLLEMADAAVNGDSKTALNLCADLKAFHEAHFRRDEVIEEHFDRLAKLLEGLSILGEMTPRSIDAVSSFGERLSSYIVARKFLDLGIDAEHADARHYLITDDRHAQAAPIYAETYRRLKLLPRGKVVVMGGFIGATEDGVTTTLGRGGSDFSAAILGAGLDAEEIQIWTDVDGMLTADPRVMPGGHRVKALSFAEAAELAYFGAKVLHPSTVVPAVEKNIPVLILNSRRPETTGTRIVNESVVCANAVKSIACKTNITVVDIRSTRMLMAHGFLRRIFEVFDHHRTPVDMVATSEVSVSLTIDNAAKLPAILDGLRGFADAEATSGQAIVCLVGDNIRHTPGVAGRVFSSIGGVNIRMIAQGASRLNLSFVVSDADLRVAVESLHAEFFSTLDPAVFD